MAKIDPHRTALDSLAAEVRAATDFSSAFDSFDRGLGSNRRFIRACEVAKSELLERTLDHLAQRFGGGRTGWSWLAPLLRYAPGRFLHGAALVGGLPTVLFYFEERDLGLACIAGPECHFARISALALPPGAILSRGRGTT